MVVAHIERQHLPYSTEQLFDLVADVERYPNFMPWVIDATVRRRVGQAVTVDMTIGVGPIRKQFATVGMLHRPDRIDVHSSDPLFVRFEQHWMFESLAEGGTSVEYHVEFELRSRLLRALVSAALAGQAEATVSAFERRAKRLYGTRP